MTSHQIPAQLSIGRGIADITGQPWGVGMMGYGMPDQRSNGILSRQYARAFVFEADGSEVVYVVADIGMFFQAGVEAILTGLAEEYGDRFTARNVVLTATHTHCGPGGHGQHQLYNVTTFGFHEQTFQRLVDGVLGAVRRAVADLAPTEAILTRGRLSDASANRAASAFARNPEADRAEFPAGIDPHMTLLRLERGGALVGAIDWFGVHNTSMTNRNCLISADNKGLAAYLWEGDGAAPRTERAELVTAFAQTNAGDLSPNLDLEPGRGPTDDERENTRIIAERQLAEARRLASQPGESLAPVVEARMIYVNLADQTTPEGSTASAVLGASFAAGKLTDGHGSPLFDEGLNNPIPGAVSRFLYRRSSRLEQAHAPKEMLIPIGAMRWAQQVFPVQIVRIGRLVLVCLPFEVTVVSGLRIRRAVSTELAVPLDDVLCQGYANGYGHYITTPAEYDVQRYEGGSTVFGRAQLPAVVAACARLAASFDGPALPTGPTPPPHRLRLFSPLGRVKRSLQPVAVRRAPSTARVGEVVRVLVDADHPNATIASTYLLVERYDGAEWRTVADDSTPSTSITWSRRRGQWSAEITWVAQAAGTYRISYHGCARATTEKVEVRAD